MTTLRGVGENRYLAPGTRVCLAILVNERDLITPEAGVVTHCWRDEREGMFKCLVVFFGEDLPDGEPVEEPYFLKHAATSLSEMRA